MTRKGIILAGGTGSRLWPITHAVSKHLLPVYDKPMIYYPLSTLMLAGIREVLIITNAEYLDPYKILLGDGSKFGMEFYFSVQHRPAGIAEALTIAEDFLSGNPCCLILGDNFFYGSQFTEKLDIASQNIESSTIFIKQVNDPRRYGVVEFNDLGDILKVHEKPQNAPSSYAVSGLYFFDENASYVAKSLKPSARGELEITDVINKYSQLQKLKYVDIGRGTTWFDMGTPASLLAAGNFVSAVQLGNGDNIANLEEIALSNFWVSKQFVNEQLHSKETSDYYGSVRKIIRRC